MEITKTRLSICLGILLIGLCGCASNKDHASAALFAKIEASCQAKEDSCIISFAEIITDIEWDRVAFIKMQAWAENPAETVGIDELKMNEFEDLIVFAQDRKAVEVIRTKYDPEQATEKSVNLEFKDDRTHIQIFPKPHANFKAQIQKTPSTIHLMPN